MLTAGLTPRPFELRERWAQLTNEALAAGQRLECVDHRTPEAQGIDPQSRPSSGNSVGGGHSEAPVGG